MYRDSSPAGESPRVVGRKTEPGGFQLPVTQFVVDAGQNVRLAQGKVADRDLSLDDIWDQECALSKLVEHLYSTCADRFQQLEALKAELRRLVPLPLSEAS